MREPVKDKGRLEHIVQAIENVREYTSGVQKDQLQSNKILLHATAYNIQIIGEACYKLTKEFKEAHSETPWRLIEKMRHILVHDYFAVDFEFLWLVVTEDLSALYDQVVSYLQEPFPSEE